MTLRIFSCGDIFVGDRGFTVDKKLSDILRSCDVRIANLEGSIGSRGKPIPKIGPVIQQSPAALDSLVQAGFNAVTLANNHIFDLGSEGLSFTLKELQEKGFFYFGAGLYADEIYTGKIYEKNGLRIGLLSVCENEFGCLSDETIRSQGYAWINHSRVLKELIRLRGEVDYLILFCHAGLELEDLPLPEWREKYRSFCDLGADFVIGHHPHVPQGFEKWGGSVIFYSLGNFFFDGDLGGNSETDESYSVILEFSKNKKSFEIIPHKKNNIKVCYRHEYKKLEKLNSALLSPDYIDKINARAIDLYKGRYLDYYERIFDTIPPDLSLKTKIARFIYFLRARKVRKNPELMLLHNIKIESHRFIVVRALELLTKKVLAD